MKRALIAVLLSLISALWCACVTPKIEQKQDNEQIQRRAQEASQDLAGEEAKHSDREE